MSEIDLTDYVEIGAKAYIKTHSQYDWEKLTELQKYNAREVVLPVVQEVIEAYVENHPDLDIDWLEG